MLNYRPRIDGLRFVAIASVLSAHLGGYLTSADMGYYGVDLFFVISGYLITGILLRDTGHTFGQSYRAFIGRRALRIFPAYYLLVFVLAAVDFSYTRDLFAWLVTYTFNYVAPLVDRPGHPSSLVYLWSLSVEEQFYLAWPPLVLLLRGRKTTLLAITLLVVVIGYAQISHNIFPAITQYNYTGTLNRMGSLGLGALGATWVSQRPLPSWFFQSRLVEAAVLAVTPVSIFVDFPYRYVVMGLSSLFLVLKAAHFTFRMRPVEWLLTNRRVVSVGMISYGIYLYHVPVGLFTSEYLFDQVWLRIPFAQLGVLEKLQWHSWVIKFPLYSAMTIAVAAASYRWFESPILGLKDKFFPYAPGDGRSPASEETDLPRTHPRLPAVPLAE